MPIYAYKCASCGLAKDVLQKISDDPLTVCPDCKAATFNKQLTAAGFQLKGSGWYVTDFKGGPASVPAAAADAGAKPSESSSTVPAPSTSSESSASATTISSPPASSDSKPAAAAGN